MKLGKVVNRVTYIRCCSGAQGSADGHRRTSAGEIRKREREHEKRRTIFAQLSMSRDYSDHERVQRYVHDYHCTDCQSLDIVEIASIHVDDSPGVSDVVSPRSSTNVDRVRRETTFDIYQPCGMLQIAG